jgi:hypothetical protein
MKPVPPLADITDVLPEKVENTTPTASPFTLKMVKKAKSKKPVKAAKKK